MKINRKRCGQCSHGSAHFKAFGTTHLHCCHPDKDVADLPPQGTIWGTLRAWFHTGCDKYEGKKKEKDDQ
jgi:hypothetical protein